jgi:hypothetical protein
VFPYSLIGLYLNVCKEGYNKRSNLASESTQRFLFLEGDRFHGLHKCCKWGSLSTVLYCATCLLQRRSSIINGLKAGAVRGVAVEQLMKRLHDQTSGK